MERIVVNVAKCLKCGDIIESKHRHDFVECSCGNLFVDGGHDYIRRGYNDADSWVELSKTECDISIQSRSNTTHNMGSFIHAITRFITNALYIRKTK